MLDMVFSFLRGKLNTPAAALLIPIVLLIVYIVFANFDQIANRFGIETKSSLKASNVELRTQVRLLEEESNKLRELLIIASGADERTADIIVDLYEDKEAVEGIIRDLIKERDKDISTKVDCPEIIKIVDSGGKNPMTIQAELLKEKERSDKISQSNIDTIHKAFAAFSGV